MARVNEGRSSKARWYASVASSELPPFASVAPSRFHSWQSFGRDASAAWKQSFACSELYVD